MNDQRNARQSAMFPDIHEVTALVVGVGAIGRQAALALGGVGTQQLTICDFDTVDEVNLGNQLYNEEDLGELKVEATDRAISRLNSAQVTLAIQSRATRHLITTKRTALFACVDTMASRKFIFDALEEGEVQEGCLIDARMGGDTIRILLCDLKDEDSRLRYRQTLYRDEQAVEGQCTARSTVYTALIAGGLMVHRLSAWLRGIPVTQDFLINLNLGVVDPALVGFAD